MLSDDLLEDLFTEARSTPPVPSDALMARIEADASAQIGQQAGGMTARFRTWWQLLGGAPGIGGLATTAVVGFWIGFAPPAVLDPVSESLLPLAGVEDGTAFAPGDGFGWSTAEG